MWLQVNLKLFMKQIWLEFKERMQKTKMSLVKSLMLMELNIILLKYKFIHQLSIKLMENTLIWRYKLYMKHNLAEA